MLKKILLTSIIVGSSVYAQEGVLEEYNTALKIGTLGVGIDVSRMVDKDIALRANINGLTYNRNDILDDVPYEGDIKLLTIGLLADYYPSESNFRLSAGVYYNNNNLSATATPGATETIEIGNNTYTGSDIGSMNTGMDFNALSPYIGIGWGNKPSKGNWSFSFDLGVLYQGAPNIDVEAVPNPLLPEAVKNQLAQDIEVERQNLESDLDKYRWYPVVMLGVSYTF